MYGYSDTHPCGVMLGCTPTAPATAAAAAEEDADVDAADRGSGGGSGGRPPPLPLRWNGSLMLMNAASAWHGYVCWLWSTKYLTQPLYLAYHCSRSNLLPSSPLLLSLELGPPLAREPAVVDDDDADDEAT